jgi:predicted MFS family arabinose efflux permease
VTSTLTARPAGTRLRPLYATGFIHGFALWYAVEKLFMKSIGFNDFLITIATITYIVVMTAANLPLGVLADRWSRKGVLYLATCALITGTLICGLSHGFWMYAAGLSVWGVFYACYAGTYDSIIYDTVLEETGSADSYEHWFGRVQMYDSVAFITGALASAVVANFVSLRAEFFLTIPITCCAFFTLSRFREPSLHKQAERVRLRTHLGQLWKAMTASSAVAWIAAALVCNLLAMRLIFEFMQLWYLGLALPAALFGPSFALVYGGSWMGGKFADRLRRPAVILTAGLLVLAASAGLMFRVAPVAVGAQVVAIAGIIALQVVLSGYLHDAMPSSIRAGASSMVSTASMLAFLPVALGFGVVARDYSIFRASWLVIGAIAGMTVALAVVVARNLESRYVLRLMAAVAAGLIVAAGAVAGYELMRGPVVSITAGTTAAPPARAAIDPVPLDPGLPRPFRPSRPPVTSAPVFPAQPIVPASPASPVPALPASPSPSPTAPPPSAAPPSPPPPVSPSPSPTSPAPTAPSSSPASPSPTPTSPSPTPTVTSPSPTPTYPSPSPTSPSPSPTSPSPTSSYPSPSPSSAAPSPASPTPTGPSPSSPYPAAWPSARGG